MSKIAVIGATGKTGIEIVNQALAVGHTVIAVARRPDTLVIEHPRLEIRHGDVYDSFLLKNALPPDVEVVISAIGEKKISKPTNIYSKTAENLITLMEQMPTRRFICIAASGYIDDPQQSFVIRFLQKNVLQRILRHIYADMRRMEEKVRNSDLDWTIVRPPRLSNGEHTGNYRVQEEFVPRGAKISRADLADYIVNSVDDSRYYRSVIGVAY